MRIRKLRWRQLFRVTGLAAVSTFLMLGSNSSAEAGPFADWWLNNSGNAYAGYPNTSYAPVLPAGAPQTQVGVLPTGAYATQYYRAPTTYYRPVTAFDPRLGTTVTSLQPCASYQYQAQRVPLLVPETHTTAAYGGYGAGVPQTRYAPVLSPNSSAGASGQSMMSIPSGLGSVYTAPVVQIPANGVQMYSQAPAMAPQTQYIPQTQYSSPTTYAPTIVNGNQVVSGYGGINYGPTQTYQAPLVGNATITSPVTTAVVPAAAWTTTTTNGGYIGNAPQQFIQPAITTPSPTVPNSMQPIQSAYPPSYAPNASVTPLGPPVITAVPAQQSIVSSPPISQTFGPMPGSMGAPIMPTNVYPNSSSNSGTRDVESTIAPQLPQTNLQPILPAENTSQKPWTPEVMPSNILPDVSNDGNRFQLRRVERDFVAPNSSTSNSSLGNPSSANPFNDPSVPQTLYKPSNSIDSNPNNNPGLMPSPSLEQSPGNQSDSNSVKPNLELKLETLRPIPAPPSFDASPAWRPVLMNSRDQTAGVSTRAGLPERTNLNNFQASHSLTTESSFTVPPTHPSIPQRSNRAHSEDIAADFNADLQSNLVYFNKPNVGHASRSGTP